MNPNDFYKSITYTTGNRKKQIVIQQTLEYLHEQQLDMIDAAVDASDLSQANELINYIRSK
jgi:plasmid maintenance system killer protein